METLDLYDNLRHIYDGVCAIQSMGFAITTIESSEDGFGKGLSYIADHVERELYTLLKDLKKEMGK